MRIVGLIFTLAAVVLLVRAGWAAAWDRAMHYDAKYMNTISTTTPNATIKLKEHADLAQSAARDLDSLGVQVLGGAALALAGGAMSLVRARVT